MPTNKRIFYAVQQVKIGRSNGTFPLVHGLQSAGITTNFNLEQVFELGQLAIYQNVESLPEIEVTLNKVLDGYSPLFCLATDYGSEVDTSATATNATLAGRQNARCDLELGIFNENNTGGASLGRLYCKGMYVSSVSYTFPVDGNFTEDLTLVGNDKVWTGTSTADATMVAGNDRPNTLAGVGRRQFLNMSTSRFPTRIPGIDANGINVATNNIYATHFQNITVSCDLGREYIYELGSFAPYCRYVTFPVEVTSEFEVVATDNGDAVSATSYGYYLVAGTPLSPTYTAGNTNPPSCSNITANTKDEYIKITTCEGLTIDLGSKNKLTSVNYNGGDTGGGNVTVTYSYQTFNTFSVAHTNSLFTGG